MMQLALKASSSETFVWHKTFLKKIKHIAQINIILRNQGFRLFLFFPKEFKTVSLEIFSVLLGLALGRRLKDEGMFSFLLPFASSKE